MRKYQPLAAMLYYAPSEKPALRIYLSSRHRGHQPSRSATTATGLEAVRDQFHKHLAEYRNLPEWRCPAALMPSCLAVRSDRSATKQFRGWIAACLIRLRCGECTRVEDLLHAVPTSADAVGFVRLRVCREKMAAN